MAQEKIIQYRCDRCQEVIVGTRMEVKIAQVPKEKRFADKYDLDERCYQGFISFMTPKRFNVDPLKNPNRVPKKRTPVKTEVEFSEGDANDVT